jgi:hypothetical protein
MKLFEAFGAKGYHTSVITTFGIDFDTYENVVLNRLRGGGCNNNLLVADHRMLALSLENPVALPVDAGRLYSVSGASAAAGRVFHPKLVVQIGRHKGRLIVASANMTAAGLSGNLEVVSEVLCDEERSPEQAAVADAWSFVMHHLDSDQVSVARQVRWAIDRAPWLRTALQRVPRGIPAPGNGEDQREGASTAAAADGMSSPRFFCTGGTVGIGARFADAVAGESVRRLVVISPYWDDELRALDHLVRRLKPDSSIALIQKDQKLFPGPQASQVPALRVVDMARAGVKAAASRFVHAKLVIAQTDEADHVLAGSANCTVAALGHEAFSGLNDEASLYQRLPPGEMVKALELEGALMAQPVDAQELAMSPRVEREEIELEQGRQLNPGRFELDQTTLSWWPGTDAQAAESDGALIQLFDVEGVAVSIALLPLNHGSVQARRRYRLGPSERAPRFASVRRTDGSESAMAVIGWADHLREAAREVRRGPSARIAQEFDEEEDSGLWLLDAIDRLEDAERSEQAGQPPSEGAATDKPGQNAARGSRSARGGTAIAEHSGIAVSYEAFIAGRRPHADEFKVARSALGTSEVSAARMFMNRLLRMPTGLPWEPTSTEHAVEDVVKDKASAERVTSESLARSGADGGGSTDAAGANVSVPPSSDGGSDPVPPPTLKVRKPVTAQEYRSAVEKFALACGERASAGTLGAAQALRLRVLLTVLVAAGCPRSERALGRSRQGLLKHQILPVDSEYGWVRLVRILLFCFFGKSKALARSFNLDASLEQVPDDFLELWATCFWVGIAAAIAPQDDKPREMDEPARKLLSGVYAATALRSQELRGETVLMVIQRMSERYAEQVGVDGAEILKAHEQFARMTP